MSMGFEWSVMIVPDVCVRVCCLDEGGGVRAEEEERVCCGIGEEKRRTKGEMGKGNECVGVQKKSLFLNVGWLWTFKKGDHQRKQSLIAYRISHIANRTGETLRSWSFGSMFVWNYLSQGSRQYWTKQTDTHENLLFNAVYDNLHGGVNYVVVVPLFLPSSTRCRRQGSIPATSQPRACPSSCALHSP